MAVMAVLSGGRGSRVERVGVTGRISTSKAAARKADSDPPGGAPHPRHPITRHPITYCGTR